MTEEKSLIIDHISGMSSSGMNRAFQKKLWLILKRSPKNIQFEWVDDDMLYWPSDTCDVGIYQMVPIVTGSYGHLCLKVNDIDYVAELLNQAGLNRVEVQDFPFSKTENEPNNIYTYRQIHVCALIDGVRVYFENVNKP